MEDPRRQYAALRVNCQPISSPITNTAMQINTAAAAVGGWRQALTGAGTNSA